MNNVTISHDVDPKKWKDLLGEVAQDIQRKTHAHKYIVFNKQGELELVQSSSLKRDMRKLPLNEIEQISNNILSQNNDDVALKKDLNNSRCILLQAKVDKWNWFPHRLAREVAKVFLVLASITLFGIPLYLTFLRWERGKRMEVDKLKEKIKELQISQFHVSQNWKKEDLIKLNQYYKDVTNPQALNSLVEVEGQKYTIIDVVKNLVIIPCLQDAFLIENKINITNEKQEQIAVNSSFDKDVRRNQSLLRKDKFLNIEDKNLPLFNISYLFKRIESLQQDKVNQEDIFEIKEEVLKVIWILKNILVANEDPIAKQKRPFIEQETPIVKNLRTATDATQIKNLLKSTDLTELLRRERVLQARKLINQLVVTEEDKEWELLLQSLVSQNNLNPLSALPRHLMMRADLASRLDCFFVEGLPPIELEVIRNKDNQIERVNVKVQGHFVNQDVEKKGTNEFISQRAIQVNLSYGITLKKALQKNVSKDGQTVSGSGLEPRVHDFSLTYKEVNPPYR